MPRYVFFFAKSLVPIVICSRFHVSSSSASLWTREDPVSFCRGELVLSLSLSLSLSPCLFHVFLRFHFCPFSFALAHFRVFWKWGFLFADIIVITAIRTWRTILWVEHNWCLSFGFSGLHVCCIRCISFVGGGGELVNDYVCSFGGIFFPRWN